MAVGGSFLSGLVRGVSVVAVGGSFLSGLVRGVSVVAVGGLFPGVGGKMEARC